jgi:hypothetical protein
MWAHMVNAVLGIWIMVSPAVLGFAGTSAAPAYRIIGPLIVSLADALEHPTTRRQGRCLMPSDVELASN